jgi:hypothetical protein
MTDADELRDQLTERNFKRLFRDLGFKLNGQSPNSDGWIGKVEGPRELGEGGKGNYAVNVRHGGYRDHGDDGDSGNIFQAAQRVKGLAFSEAVEWIAEKAGIEPEAQGWEIGEGREVTSYTYRLASGEDHFEQVREAPPPNLDNPKRDKQFFPRVQGQIGSPDENDKIPYRLPEFSATLDGGPDFVTYHEGEKDADNARALCVPGTTTPYGANSLEPEQTAKHFEGLHVAIFPDNDKEGESHAKDVARTLLSVAESVKIVRLNGRPKDGGDVSDWIEQKRSDGLTEKEIKAELMDAIEAADPVDRSDLEKQSADGAPSGDGQAGDVPKMESGGQSASGERYVTKDGRIIYVKPKGDGEEKWKVVADFMAKIEREITREDGTRLYRIAGYSPEAHRAFEFDIEANEFESNQALKGAIGSAAGAEAPVRAGMTRHLAPALKMLSSDVEQRHRYKRTGWSDHGFILPGRMEEEVEVELPDSLPYRADPEAEVNQGRVALDNLIRSLGPKKTAPVLTFTLTGPVVRHADPVKRHGMFIKGRTGSLKTSYGQANLCIYGPGFIRDENLLKMGEGMTRNAAMALAGAAHDLPILFDNYKPNTGRGDRDFINLIHNVIEGGEKARLNRNAELKDRRDIRAWPLITGEDLPNSDPASLARVLAVEFKWNSGEDNPKLTKAQENHRHLAAIGREWISWLHTDEGQEVLSDLEETFPGRRKKWTAFLRERRPDMVNILRVASNLATNTLVYDAAKRCPTLREVLGDHEDDYREGLGTIAYRMGDYTCESLEARRLLKGIKSLRAAGRVNFAKRLGTDHYEDENRIGYWDEDGYYLILDLAIEAVEELYQRTDGLGGVTAQTLCSQLKDIDLVARTSRSRTTRTVRTGDGNRQRVLHLKKEALEEPEDTNE